VRSRKEESREVRVRRRTCRDKVRQTDSWAERKTVEEFLHRRKRQIDQSRRKIIEVKRAYRKGCTNSNRLPRLQAATGASTVWAPAARTERSTAIPRLCPCKADCLHSNHRGCIGRTQGAANLAPACNIGPKPTATPGNYGRPTAPRAEQGGVPIIWPSLSACMEPPGTRTPVSARTATSPRHRCCKPHGWHQKTLKAGIGVAAGFDRSRESGGWAEPA